MDSVIVHRDHGREWGEATAWTIVSVNPQDTLDYHEQDPWPPAAPGASSVVTRKVI